MQGSTLQLEATIYTREQLMVRMGQQGRIDKGQIALAGRSNVGKSSLVNALARRRQLAKVSSTPGKTRSINYYLAIPENFWLVDLPGYGYARCSLQEQKKWRDLVNFYLANCQALCSLVLLLDCRLKPQVSDQQLVAFAQEIRVHILPVLTKIDQCSQRELAQRKRQWSMFLGGCEPLAVSARHGRGIEALWGALRSCHERWLTGRAGNRTVLSSEEKRLSKV